jgi:hypothetical protein
VTTAVLVQIEADQLQPVRDFVERRLQEGVHRAEGRKVMGGTARP